MNVKEYISSGIIESYVLGLASDQERAEFEKLCTEYPELLEARLSFEEALEQRALENAISPSKDLKKQVWNTIQNSDAKLMSIDKPQAPVKSLNWLKYAVAACLILLAGSVYWNYSLYQKNTELVKEKEGYATRISDYEDQMKAMEPKPSVKMIALKGMPDAPQAMTTVYWDTLSHDVFILINNLPRPVSDKQYQIWALLDGNTIDLGLIENEYFIEQRKLLVKAKNVSQAQAFAITLEKKGGNPTPQGAMYVLGNL